MQLFKTATFYLFLHLIVFSVNVYGGCPLINGGLPTVLNSYPSNLNNLKFDSDGTIEGYYDIMCQPGYSLNTNIGGRVTCLASNTWSQSLPQCNLMTSGCSTSTLFNFLQSTNVIQVNPALTFIYTTGANNDQAVSGSNITIQCANGYTNTGGPLTIVCTQSNSWTTFPNCALNTVASTTTAAPSARCPVTNSTWIFANGYMSNTQNLVTYSDNTAQGYIIVSCSAGYVIDSVSGGVYKCNGQTWSSRPYCTKTARCSFSILQNFLNDSSVSQSLQVLTQQLSTDSNNTNQILIGSYILLSCRSGYTNTDNNLNVTCTANGQWSVFPVCIPPNTDEGSVRCTTNNGTLPMVPNGYISNTNNVQVYSDGSAEGYYDIACQPGYALNPNIGGRVICEAWNTWSHPLPQCNSLGKCLISILLNFLQNTAGIRVNPSSSFIYTDEGNNNQALGRSNITIQCADGYTNVGGSLTIVCTQSNNWTTFPNCTLNVKATTRMTTTTTPIPSVRCPVTNGMWTFANGYLSNTQYLTAYNDSTAQGYVIISCLPGYAIDSISGGMYKCNGQTWSPRPYCTQTARCNLTTLVNFVSNPSLTQGLAISSQFVDQNAGETNQVLVGSYLLFSCMSGYMNTGNNMNVTCNANGQWSTFPTCVSLMSAGKRKKKRNN